MSAKQKIMKLLRESGPELTIEEAIYKLEVLRKIEIGTAQIERGEWIEHDELFNKLLNDGKKVSDPLVRSRQRRSPTNQSVRSKPKPKPRNSK